MVLIMKPKRKAGRPSISAADSTTVLLGVKVSCETKEQLDDVAVRLAFNNTSDLVRLIIKQWLEAFKAV